MRDVPGEFIVMFRSYGDEATHRAWITQAGGANRGWHMVGHGAHAPQIPSDFAVLRFDKEFAGKDTVLRRLRNDARFVKLVTPQRMISEPAILAFANATAPCPTRRVLAAAGPPPAATVPSPSPLVAGILGADLLWS
jgi:hypothetical protein